MMVVILGVGSDGVQNFECDVSGKEGEKIGRDKEVYVQFTNPIWSKPAHCTVTLIGIISLKKEFRITTFH